MGKQKWVLVGCMTLLFGALYSIGRFKPIHRDNPMAVAKDAAKPPTANMNDLIQRSKTEVDSIQLVNIRKIESNIAQSKTVFEEIELLKELSKKWNDLGYFAVGGHYAERIATLYENADTTKSEEAWSIAGTTYGIGFQRTNDIELRDLIASKAIHCFKEAIKRNPANTAHRVNLAVTYVEGTSNPMTGIQLLRKILAEEPENVSVLFVLGKFAMRTGQYDKAVERFEKIISIPKIDKTDLTESYFLLAESYKMLNQSAKAKEAYEKCLALADDPALKEGLQKAIKELK